MGGHARLCLSHFNFMGHNAAVVVVANDTSPSRRHARRMPEACP